jgi:pimeloyl-ACP methyl ester carboxylesterase
MRLLLRHQLDATAELRGVRTPIAIIAGERDRLIPAARTEALGRTMPNLVFARTIAGAGHNDLYQNSMSHEAMRDALEQVRPVGG